MLGTQRGTIVDLKSQLDKRRGLIVCIEFESIYYAINVNDH